MTHVARFSLVATALLFAVSAFTLPARADTETVSGCNGCNGYTFQATLTPTSNGTYHLSYTITNVSGAAATPLGWALKLFPNGSNVTSFSNFAVTQGNTTNTGAYNLVGLGLCNPSISGAMCVIVNGTGTPSAIGKGQSVTFSFDFACSNCSGLSAWDFLSYGACASGAGTCYAINAYGKSATVPEPSVLALLASELVLMLGALMLFRPTRNRIFRNWASAFRLQPRPTS
jgi:hypothetical protein